LGDLRGPVALAVPRAARGTETVPRAARGTDTVHRDFGLRVDTGFPEKLQTGRQGGDGVLRGRREV